MKKGKGIGFLVLVLLYSVSTSAQTVDLINLDQLYNRVEKGRDTVFIINFWATWCVPCVEELPNFEKLSQEYKNEKMKLLLISLDSRSKLQASVLPFVKKNKIINEVYLLNESDPQIYIDRIDKNWSGAIPATLMLKQKEKKFFEKEFTFTELLNEYKKFSAL